MKKIFLYLLIISSFGLKAQTNLIQNGGFETEMENWHGDVASISPYDKKVGKNSCIINQFIGKDWKGIDQTINIPKKTYALEFSVWIKTEGIEGGKEAYNAGIMTVDFTNAASQSISNQNIAQVQGTTNWTLYKKIILVPEKAKEVRIMLALAQTSGSIYYDDVKVISISENEYSKASPPKDVPKIVENISALRSFSNGNFENGVKNWSDSTIISNSDKKEGNSSAVINSTTNEWKAIDQSANIPGNIKAIEISGWLKAENIKQGKQAWNNGMFIAEFTKDEKTKTIDDQLIGTVTNSTDWTFFKKKIQIPEGTKNFRIMIALSECTGTLFADDIQIKMLSE